jgi:type IV pilus assembly protein PilV
MMHQVDRYDAFAAWISIGGAMNKLKNNSCVCGRQSVAEGSYFLARANTMHARISVFHKARDRMSSPRRARGASLIEVLIAVLVFGVGIVGLAGLLIVSFRSNQVGYLRTQAEFVAMGMADRMRANPLGVWAGAYDSTSYPLTVTQDCTKAAACTPAQLAKRDQAQWSSQLKTFLPTPSASIACTKGATADATQLQMRPPYGGNCVMKISWIERAATDNKTAAATTSGGGTVVTRTYAWNFQP